MYVKIIIIPCSCEDYSRHNAVFTIYIYIYQKVVKDLKNPYQSQITDAQHLVVSPVPDK